VRVLYLTPGVFDKGGISRYNRFQIRALREAFGAQNIRVFSLMGRQPGDFEEPFETDFAGSMPLSTESRALFAISALREALLFKPDLVLCALVNLGPIAFLCGKPSGALVAQNIYGREIWSHNGLTSARRAALRRTRLIISDCYNTANWAWDMGLNRRRPEVVWDCVDTVRYSAGVPNWGSLKKYGLERSGRFCVMFLGRIEKDSRYKGFERLLHLISMLPADRFEAAICGKGDDLDHVKSLGKELTISDRTTITGAIHENDMPEVYRAADAFYLVSEVGPGMGEGIPLTPMEAMACGVPILAGNQDGSRELLEGSGGWCGAPGDLEGQRAYLESLASNEELHKREKFAARERAAAVFGYERFASETISAIEKALSAGNGKGS
jgi:phosphatidylinositol alpha-1,6-mannosyltransferase